MPDATKSHQTEEHHASESHSLAVYVAEKERQPGERTFAFLLILLGAFGYYFALDLSSDSYSSPSVFPKIASVVILAGGLISLVRAYKRPLAATAQNLLSYLLPKKVLMLLVLMVLYCLALPYLHFPASSFLFLVLSLTLLYRGRHFFRLCLYSAAAVAILFLLFRYVMLVILP